MKNWLYFPFLILMAVTYTRVADNFSEKFEESVAKTTRAPASVEIIIENECMDLPAHFNPHFTPEICN